MSSPKPVMVLTVSGDCPPCQDWRAIWKEQAKAHPEYKFAVSDAVTFGFPADRGPIMSTIVPGIGTSYLQQLPKLDGEGLKNFWEARIATTKEEQDDASHISTLNESAKALTADIVKENMTGKAGPKTDAEAALLGQVSNELVERKTRVIEHLKVDIDQSLM